MAKETLASMLDDFINEQLDQIVLSNPAEKDHLLKVKVRPMLMKGALVFQAEEFTRTQAFHKISFPAASNRQRCCQSLEVPRF